MAFKSKYVFCDVSHGPQDYFDNAGHAISWLRRNGYSLAGDKWAQSTGYLNNTIRTNDSAKVYNIHDRHFADSTLVGEIYVVFQAG